MTASPVDAPYSLKRVQELLGLQPAVVRALVARGFVEPQRGARRELRFTFQDLLLLKTAETLRRASVPTRRILASLATLRDGLPAEVPLTGLRITSAGADVAVRDAGGVREAMTGQLLLDFEVRVEGATLRLVSNQVGAEARADWFRIGQRLEEADVVQAEQAYRLALVAAPGHVDALVNLGALLCEAGRCAEAVELFEAAVAGGATNALLHFNHAVALEDVDDLDRAAGAYRAALALEPTLADAHFNLARLLERAGDSRGALRHLSAYRRHAR